MGENAQKWLTVATALLDVGVPLVGRIAEIFSHLRPDHGLSKDEINAIEQAAFEDDQARKKARLAMAQPSEPAAPEAPAGN